MNRYLFLVGAPGSMWSSVSANIYNSTDIDHSDSSVDRVYSHGDRTIGVFHHGAYFDPGMEFGNWFNNISDHTKEENEVEFNRPFANNNESTYRIIKSHTLATQLDYITTNWPTAKIILAYRPDEACFDWWNECGGHDITYPNYAWYETDKRMKEQITLQNRGIEQFIEKHKLAWDIKDNLEMCAKLNIAQPTDTYQNYLKSDIKVGLFFINE